MSAPQRRIAVCTQGTRGDFQPFLALALHLRKCGYGVMIFADPGAINAAKEFGIPGCAVSDTLKDLLTTKNGLKAMISGDLIDLAAQDSDEEEEEEEKAEPEAAETAAEEEVDWMAVFNKSMDEFNPSLVLWSSLIQFFAVPWCRRNKVPDISVPLQPQTSPSNEFKPISFQRIPVDPEQPLMSLWLMSAQVEASRYFTNMEMVEQGAKELGQKFDPEGAVQGAMDMGLATPEQTYDELFNIEASGLIKMCAFSPAFWAAPKEWPQGGIQPGKAGGIEVVGRWEITKDVQSEMSGGSGAFFGNNQAAIDFFKAGEPPVYLGWGSMVVYSKEWMARLAVGALMHAGKRGIILGGWANISADCLDGAENAEELKAYSEKHVLFLKSAPHEWLFPQCKAAVHHGGIGTTQASLGAGCPTIITPVFADQHDIAHRVENVLKVGKRTQLFSKIKLEELGEAIKVCCDDVSIQKNTKELAARMAEENGCARAEEVIRRFLDEDYSTGKWEKARVERTAAYKARRLQLHKQRKEAIFTMWNADCCKKYREMAEHNGRTISQLSAFADLAKKGVLWCVKAASGALAKEGESIKTAEVGRYTQWTIVEQLDLKKKKDTTRLQVRRKKGVGPDQGWVSITNKGNEVMIKIDDIGAVQMVITQQLASLFSNLMPRDKKKPSKNSALDSWRKNLM